MKKNEIYVDFLQDDISVSHKNVLRGIHGDNKTYKLVSCLYGEFQLIVVNNNPESKMYKKWKSFHMSFKNREQILIPPKFGNGHLVMSKSCVFSYKLNAYYDRESQFTLSWNDKTVGIWWPINDPILSERDALL